MGANRVRDVTIKSRAKEHIVVSNEIHEDSENEPDRAHKLPWHPIGAVEPAGGTDAEKIDADRLEEPAVVAGLRDPDPGLATDAERIEADRLEQPSSVAGLTNPDPGLATDAERIEADGLEQPSSVAGLTNLDDGQATDAQKIDADGLD